MLNIPIVAFWVHFISTYTNRNTNLFLLKRLLRLFILNVQKILFPRKVHQRFTQQVGEVKRQTPFRLFM